MGDCNKFWSMSLLPAAASSFLGAASSTTTFVVSGWEPSFCYLTRLGSSTMVCLSEALCTMDYRHDLATTGAAARCEGFAGPRRDCNCERPSLFLPRNLLLSILKGCDLPSERQRYSSHSRLVSSSSISNCSLPSDSSSDDSETRPARFIFDQAEISSSLLLSEPSTSASTSRRSILAKNI